MENNTDSNGPISTELNNTTSPVIQPSTTQTGINGTSADSSMRNWILIFLALLVIILLMGTYFYFLHTPASTTNKKINNVLRVLPTTIIPTSNDQTSSWRTYTNSKYNYSLKLPPSFRYDDKVSMQTKNEFMHFYQLNDIGDTQKGIDVIIGFTVVPTELEQICAKDAEKCYNTMNGTSFVGKEDIYATVEATIDGKNVKGLEYWDSTTLPDNKVIDYYEYPLNVQGKFFLFRFQIENYPLVEAKAKEEVIKQILSTFNVGSKLTDTTFEYLQINCQNCQT